MPLQSLESNRGLTSGLASGFGSVLAAGLGSVLAAGFGSPGLASAGLLSATVTPPAPNGFIADEGGRAGLSVGKGWFLAPPAMVRPKKRGRSRLPEILRIAQCGIVPPSFNRIVCNRSSDSDR